MAEITKAQIDTFAPALSDKAAIALASALNAVLPPAQITGRRFVHFMAQVAHESGGLGLRSENLSYSANRISEIFGVGKHSAKVTPAEAAKLAHKPEALAERVYGLGNPKKAKELGNTDRGDGYKYRGRGLIQITGKGAYERHGEKIGVDIVSDPDKALEVQVAVAVAVSYWIDRGCNAAADADDILKVTKLVNGGTNGLEDRKRWLAKAKSVWINGAVNSVAKASKALVKAVQQAITDKGYPVGAIDGDYGRLTRDAILAFQDEHNLPLDGQVSASLLDAISESEGRQLAPSRAEAEPSDVRDISSIARDALKGKGLAVAGAGVAAVPAIPDGLESAQEGVEKLVAAKDKLAVVTNGFRSVTDFAVDNWQILAFVALAAVVFFYFRKVERTRLAEHREGRTR